MRARGAHIQRVRQRVSARHIGAQPVSSVEHMARRQAAAQHAQATLQRKHVISIMQDAPAAAPLKQEYPPVTIYSNLISKIFL